MSDVATKLVALIDIFEEVHLACPEVPVLGNIEEVPDKWGKLPIPILSGNLFDFVEVFSGHLDSKERILFCHLAMVHENMSHVNTLWSVAGILLFLPLDTIC